MYSIVFSVKAHWVLKKDSTSSLPGADKFRRGWCSWRYHSKGWQALLPGCMDPPLWAHYKQLVDICWIKERMNVCWVTKPSARCTWYKTKWHSPCSQRIQPNGKERPKNCYYSMCSILLVAMLRPFGDIKWSLIENDTDHNSQNMEAT